MPAAARGAQFGGEPGDGVLGRGGGPGQLSPAGVVRGVVTWDDLLPLMCGIAFAAEVRAEDRRTRLESGRRYLAVMLRGMRG